MEISGALGVVCEFGFVYMGKEGNLLDRCSFHIAIIWTRVSSGVWLNVDPRGDTKKTSRV